MIPAPDLYFLFAFPVVLILVIGFLVLGGRLEGEKRQRVERVIAAIIYPLIALFWLWKAYDYGAREQWALGVAMLGVGLIFVMNGIRSVHQGRLAPRKRAR
ncbi:hypothetical protein GGQ87_002094 [Brevundimonas alba]|uniref:Uncharacterized protein n=1 Tax=Brevundimonas alba TaxID=74314 RepID=A0A7X5YNA4_9CAUL|nr:hypothetical protein [Brevundimonas alba]NJC41799.1 hypothetical protein [Brevundimonas alba]